MNYLGSIAGVIGYANQAPYLDLPGRLMLLAPRRASSTDLYDMILANAYWGSAMEHIALEQTNPSPCVSTIKMVNYAAENGASIYLANQSNYNIVVSELSNYDQAHIDVQSIQNVVQNGNGKALLVQNQAMQYGLYQGTGYMLLQTVSGGGIGIRMGISGGLSGGFSTQHNNLHSTPFPYNWATSPLAASLSPPIQHPTYMGDPVDASNGSFYNEETDLALGDASPHGLLLTRQYSSARNLLDPTKLGKGWTHSYYMKLAQRHPNDMDVRRASVAELAPLAITSRVILDLVKSNGTAREWVIPALSASWAGDQMVNSRISITMGAKGVEFVKMPDGAFVSPPGVSAKLIKESSGKYVLKYRKGLEILFRDPTASTAAGRFESITDKNNPNGTSYSATATYEGDNLSQVADSFSRWIKFVYTSDKLTKAHDSTGREVIYTTGSNYFEITNAASHSSRLYMNAKHLVTGLEDARARTVITFEYDAEDRMCLQKVFGDNSRTWYYGFAPGVGRETDPKGYTKWTYFDSKGRKVTSIDQKSARSDWIYDGSDRVAADINGEGEQTFTKYNKNHEVVWIKNAAGDEMTITPSNDDSSTVAQDVSFAGRLTKTELTSYHKPKKTTLPGNLVASYDYDSRGRINKVHPASYADGKFINYTYEDDPYPVRVTATYPDNTKEIADYNARGDIIASIDRRGAKVTFKYNELRQKTKVYRWSGLYDENSDRNALPPADSIVTEAEYDNNGCLKTAKDPLGRRMDYDYDAQGKIVEVKGPDDLVLATNTYDIRDQLEISVDALGAATTYQYHETQKLKRTSDPLSRPYSKDYDLAGKIKKITTPLNYSTGISYDTANRKRTTTDPHANNSVYEMDKDGRLLRYKNRRNAEYTWSYDDSLRTTTTTTPLLRSTVLTSNARGLVASIKEPSTQTSTYNSYDDEGRPLQITDGDNVVTEMTYWPGGLLKTVKEGAKSSLRSYDDLGRIKSYKDDDGNIFSYEYHADGKVKKITYPGETFLSSTRTIRMEGFQN
ncbi:MAG: DUF6531 domain-containing protein [Nibricoccus sp.]